MRTKIINYMRKFSYYTYRFDDASNYITYEQWLNEQADLLMKSDRLELYIKINKLDK